MWTFTTRPARIFRGRRATQVFRPTAAVESAMTWSDRVSLSYSVAVGTVELPHPSPQHRSVLVKAPGHRSC